MRMKDNLSELEQKQMETISQLQEQIKLRDFDISELKREKRELKKKIVSKKEVIKISLKELKEMREKSNYNRILNVLNILYSSLNDKE